MPLLRDDEARHAIQELATRLTDLENRYEERISHLGTENRKASEAWRVMAEKVDAKERAHHNLNTFTANRERIWRS